MAGILLILHGCLICFFSALSGLYQKDPGINQNTTCCIHGEKCAYKPSTFIVNGKFFFPKISKTSLFNKGLFLVKTQQ